MNKHAHGDVLRRQDEILRVVREQSVHSQDELLALMKKKGFRVTQPTLSRDLRELGVAKSPNGYITRDAFAGGAVVAFAPRDVVETRLEQAVAEFATGADTRRYPHGSPPSLSAAQRRGHPLRPAPPHRPRGARPR